MGYKDIFDDSFSTPASDKSEKSSAVTPLTPEPEEQQQLKPLLFPGFGSGRPLLFGTPQQIYPTSQRYRIQSVCGT